MSGPQPNSEASTYPSTKPNPIRNLSEFAVADTPGTSGSEFTGSRDYLECRFAPPSPSPSFHAKPQMNQRVGGRERGGGGGEGGGMPTALAWGVRGGGPTNGTERKETQNVDRGEQQAEGVAERQNENVDADGTMEMYAEGKVAHAVERARRRGSPASQGLHGRGRGEVRLEPGEADLERKKQQQAAARKQVTDARKRGEDVDGLGTAGPTGRQPRAGID